MRQLAGAGRIRDECELLRLFGAPPQFPGDSSGGRKPLVSPGFLRGGVAVASCCDKASCVCWRALVSTSSCGWLAVFLETGSEGRGFESLWARQSSITYNDRREHPRSGSTHVQPSASGSLARRDLLTAYIFTSCFPKFSPRSMPVKALGALSAQGMSRLPAAATGPDPAASHRQAPSPGRRTGAFPPSC